VISIHKPKRTEIRAKLQLVLLDDIKGGQGSLEFL